MLSDQVASERLQLSAYVRGYKAEIVAQYYAALTETLFTDRSQLRPAMLLGIARAEVDELLRFLRDGQVAAARGRGEALCRIGLSDEAIIVLGQTTRRFCLANLEEPLRYVVLETIGDYHAAELQGFFKALKAITLEEQEQMRSALQRTLSQYVLQMEVAADVARAATSSLDLPVLLHSTANLIRQRFDLFCVSIYLVDEHQRWAVLEASTEETAQGYRLRIGGDSLVGWCIAQGESRIALDVGNQADSFVPPPLSGVHSEMVLPLLSRQTVLGAIELQSQRVAAFGDSDVTVMRIIADQLANGIHNARLFEQVKQELTERRRAEEAEREQRMLAESLRDTAAALTGTLNLEEVLDHVLENISRVVPYDTARIVLLEGDMVYFARSRGLIEKDASVLDPTDRYPLSEFPALRRMLESGQALVVADTNQDPGWMHSAEAEWVHSYLGSPLRHGDRAIGFLTLRSSKAGFYTPADAQRLQAFADQVGMAMENARLYQEIRRHAAVLELRVAERTAELRAANDRLQEMDELKNKFISNISHELRTPLSSLKIYLRLVETGKVDKRPEYLSTLYREVDRLHQLIEDLLRLSWLEMRSVRADLQPLDIHELVSTLIADRRMLARERGLQLEAASGAERAIVLADARLLMQVLSNLTTNAMNYTPAGGRITLRTDRQPTEGQSWITVAVSDTGPGIAPEDQVHLFERFYRGEVGRNSRLPGTGLGLAICQEIMELHQGRITVQSQVGQGSTFTIWLPAFSATESQESANTATG